MYSFIYLCLLKSIEREITCCNFHCLSSRNAKCMTWLLLATLILISCKEKKLKIIISIFFIESNNSKSNQWAQINCAAKSHYNYTGWQRPFVKYKLRPKWHTMHALSTQSCSVWIIYEGILSFITESDAPIVSSTLKSPIAVAEAKQCYSCWKQTLGSWCCETYSQPESELLLVVSKPLSPGPS